jgi:alkanesulfonate monooxygenase SsuD/methylene tetrahydromethanopterin reductase-like flavin-dependent oxidoreductase (luciferase family)
MSGNHAPALFGVNVAASAADPVAQARAAEELGFDFVSTSDHPGGTEPTFETWTLLTWMAAATTRIAFLPRVLAVPIRPPAVIAKMAETFDRLSGGRLIVGLGAGGSDQELRSLGAAAQTPGQKVTGLSDAITIIRGLWTGTPFSHDGAVHRVEAAELAPKPERAVPIWLGTYGDRALGVTGRQADGWIPSLSYSPPDALRAMHGKLMAALAAAGRDPAAMTTVLNVVVRIDAHAEPAPGTVVGSAGAVLDQLVELSRIGFGSMNVMPSGPDLAGQVHRIGTEVVPALRDAVA